MRSRSRGKGSHMTESTRIVFLHGLESGPTGTKARWLAERYGATAVDLDTRAAVASHAEAAAAGVPWDFRWPSLEAAFRVPMVRARAAITADTGLLVGSSFGGAVLTRLLTEGSWAGPSLLIAPAGLKLTGRASLPAGPPILLVHGRRDDVVPVEDSRRVAAESGANVVLWEIGDDHRMATLMSNGLFEAAIAWLRSRS